MSSCQLIYITLLNFWLWLGLYEYSRRQLSPQKAVTITESDKIWSCPQPIYCQTKMLLPPACQMVCHTSTAIPFGWTACCQRKCQLSLVIGNLSVHVPTSNHNKARFIVTNAEHSREWLLAIPITACGFRLGNEAYRAAVVFRFGLNLYEAHTFQCARPCDDDARSLHVWSFKPARILRGGGPILGPSTKRGPGV